MSGRLAHFGLLQSPAGGGATDPDFASVALLLHFNGSNGQTTTADSGPFGKTMTAHGNAQLTTAQNRFGPTSSVFDGSGDFWDTPSSSDFDIGTGDFTIEAWVKFSAAGNGVLFDRLTSPSNNPGLQIEFFAGGIISVYANGSARITGATNFNDGNWHFMQVSRSGSNLRAYMDGAQQGSTATFSGDVTAAVPLCIGAVASGGGGFNGYIDDFRLTIGVARANSVPSAQFPDS